MKQFSFGYILSAILFVVNVLVNAQPIQPVKCYTSEYIQRQELADPGLRARMLHEQEKLREKLDQSQLFKLSAIDTVFTIPVVFHVVYNDGSQDLSTSRINEQLQVLNNDYSATNADLTSVPSAFQPYIGNSKMQFCLAQQDPSGNSTSGITRTYTSTTSFSSNDDVKFATSGGHDIWDRDKYLNIWICKLSGGVVGFSSFPGASADVDGVVIDYRYCGVTGALTPYNLGRSLSHELGHWFNLSHIWGDTFCGDDLVADTPTQQSANYGSSGNCPAFPHVTCSNGPNGDMWMNFMDYGYDKCALFFTAGQCDRMRTTLGVSRPTLKTSIGCVLGVNEIKDVVDFSMYPNPANDKLIINLSLQKPENIQLNIYNMLGAQVLVKTIENYYEGAIQLDLHSFSQGVYSVELITQQTKQNRRVVVEK